ncbi:hypothetical protein ALO95_200232 [Pseudomonas syringae pv. antirrhini]|uniref:hypothetical protein n=1 Tax=Pseudomonas TaxID=286 RepID=UPI000EFD0245|nr:MULTISPECIES: hypothetical protein [Pseudomonas]RMP38545.1 hypothetical protein ALQ24_200068 [Pseudomonas syringae pv. antirrhini]RMP41758.1 hypothetical protein ALQ23_200046 [Pseudomonas syringae pv. antirrhini]RMW24168.1 hypothetical protein ALO95_200232 [Pseudomonas syringae pv. antirrhini]WIN10117.1 hypothetical protein QQF68_28130 [Pseudomonas syringae pv. antirrhini str. 126]
MRKILAASVFFASLVTHAASVPVEPVRVQLLTDKLDPAKGDQLAFEMPGGCVLAGSVNAARLVVINRKVCPSGTTNVTMVVPLDKQASFKEAQSQKNSAALEWLTESSRNYYLFPVEAAVDTQSPTMN